MEKELPKRKCIRLQEYDYNSVGTYFLTICIKDRKNILSTISVVGWLKYQATREINTIRSTPGEQVFQRSFYDHIIRNHHDYEKIRNYILENPYRWYYNKLYTDG